MNLHRETTNINIPIKEGDVKLTLIRTSGVYYLSKISRTNQPMNQ